MEEQTQAEQAPKPNPTISCWWFARFFSLLFLLVGFGVVISLSPNYQLLTSHDTASLLRQSLASRPLEMANKHKEQPLVINQAIGSPDSASPQPLEPSPSTPPSQSATASATASVSPTVLGDPPPTPQYHYSGPLPPPGKPPRLVISLTTIPSRLVYVYDAIRGVSWSPYLPDAIYLCIPRESLRLHRPYEVPPFITSNPNVTVLWSDLDYGPATKLLPVLRVETDPDTLIVTIDDDSFTKPHHLQVIVTASMMFPNAAIGFGGWNVSCLFTRSCARTRTQEYLFVRQSYNFGCVTMREMYGEHHCASEVKTLREPKPADVIEGYEGAAYRRKFFDDSIFDFSSANKEMFFVDDVWISGNLALHNIPRLIVYNGEDIDRHLLVPPNVPERVWFGPSNTSGTYDPDHWIDPNTVDALHGGGGVDLMRCNLMSVIYFRKLKIW